MIARFKCMLTYSIVINNSNKSKIKFKHKNHFYCPVYDLDFSYGSKLDYKYEIENAVKGYISLFVLISVFPRGNFLSSRRLGTSNVLYYLEKRAKGNQIEGSSTFLSKIGQDSKIMYDAVSRTRYHQLKGHKVPNQLPIFCRTISLKNPVK